VAPRPLVEEDLRLGRLIAPFGFVRSGRRYCLLYPATLADRPEVRTFRNWITRSVRTSGGQ
jgi:DNA-binding transcriptional LysR family regulator